MISPCVYSAREGTELNALASVMDASVAGIHVRKQKVRDQFWFEVPLETKSRFFFKGKNTIHGPLFLPASPSKKEKKKKKKLVILKGCG